MIEVAARGRSIRHSHGDNLARALRKYAYHTGRLAIGADHLVTQAQRAHGCESVRRQNGLVVRLRLSATIRRHEATFSVLLADAEEL